MRDEAYVLGIIVIVVLVFVSIFVVSMVVSNIIQKTQCDEYSLSYGGPVEYRSIDGISYKCYHVLPNKKLIELSKYKLYLELKRIIESE